MTGIIHLRSFPCHILTRAEPSACSLRSPCQLRLDEHSNYQSIFIHSNLYSIYSTTHQLLFDLTFTRSTNFCKSPPPAPFPSAPSTPSAFLRFFLTLPPLPSSSAPLSPSSTKTPWTIVVRCPGIHVDFEVGISERMKISLEVSGRERRSVCSPVATRIDL